MSLAPYLFEFNVNIDNTATESSNDHLSVHLQQLGERLYPKVSKIFYNLKTEIIN